MLAILHPVAAGRSMKKVQHKGSEQDRKKRPAAIETKNGSEQQRDYDIAHCLRLQWQMLERS